jgi:hypothetical protein
MMESTTDKVKGMLTTFSAARIRLKELREKLDDYMFVEEEDENYAEVQEVRKQFEEHDKLVEELLQNIFNDKDCIARKIGIAALNKMFDKHAFNVLAPLGYLVQLPKANKKAPRAFLKVKDLPVYEEYIKLRNEKYSITLKTYYDNAKGDIESLKEEMEEMESNMGSYEGLTQTDKYQAVEEAVQTLQSFELPDLDDWPDIKIVDLPYLGTHTGRSFRAGCASSACETVVEKLREYAEGLKEDQFDEVKECEVRKSEIEDFCSEVETASSEIENVEFPGMFG